MTLCYLMKRKWGVKTIKTYVDRMKTENVHRALFDAKSMWK